MPVHYAGSGDSLTPLGAALKRKGTGGRLEPVNLVGRVVTAIVRNEDESIAVAETATGVSVTDAAEGLVAYDFPEPPNNLPDGWYYVQFRAYGTGGEAGEYDTYPAPDPKQRMRVFIGVV